MILDYYDGCGEEGAAGLSQSMPDSFGVYDEDGTDYSCVEKEYEPSLKLNSTDRKVLELLVRQPFLPTSAICDCADVPACKKGVAVKAGGGCVYANSCGQVCAYRRIKVLYDNGYIGRFQAYIKERDFTKSVLYVTEKCMRGRHFDMSRNVRGYNVRNMSIPTVLGLSVLSRWCVYALKFWPKGEKGVKFISYTEGTSQAPYSELVLEKYAGATFWKKGTRCRFHVISAPKAADRVAYFVGKLYHFDSVVKNEMSEAKEGLYSYVVIVCESIQQMERLAAEVNNVIYQQTGDIIEEDRFLYSLETDGEVDLGAFKFLHRVTFPEMSIVHEQVAFK